MNTERLSSPLSPSSVSALNPELSPNARASSAAILEGDSPAIRALRAQLHRIAPYFRTALLRGEPGAGKHLVARALHASSPAARGPFISVSALEAADETRPATLLLDSAAGGTLYLHGVGELLPYQQSALLRFLDLVEDRRAASAQPTFAAMLRPERTPSPVIRILAATHRDLRTLAAASQFRLDLYTRLSAVELLTPALRDRMEDLPLLAACLLRRIAQRTAASPKELSPAALAQLQQHTWPGNLTELKRALAHASAFAENSVIEPRHLLVPAEPTSSTPAAPRIEPLHQVIQRHVLEVLTRCGGNKLRTAELLGISRSTLYRMLEGGMAQPLSD